MEGDGGRQELGKTGIFQSRDSDIAFQIFKCENSFSLQKIVINDSTEHTHSAYGESPIW